MEVFSHFFLSFLPSSVMRRLYSLVLQSFLSLSSSGRGTAERPKSTIVFARVADMLRGRRQAKMASAVHRSFWPGDHKRASRPSNTPSLIAPLRRAAIKPSIRSMISDCLANR